jgi:Holliday junction resolvasome RuvABC endonuclease subunit
VIKVAGIDLSLTGTGAVAIPALWDRDWRRIARQSFGVSLEQKKLKRKPTVREITHRLHDISRDVVRWILQERATHVFVEDALTHGAWNLVPLAELRGVFRVVLLEQAGLDPVFVNQASSRKFLLGKLPPDKRKDAVVAALKAAGADFDDEDQFDAFTAANMHLESLGIPHLQELRQPFETVKISKPRARKAAA